MAFSNGKKTTEGGEFKRYIGVMSAHVLAVNPDMAELSKIYGRDFDNEPEYTGQKDVNGKNVEFARIDFILKNDEALNSIDFTTKITFFLRNEYRFNSPDAEVRKVQVIDRYGRTAWVTKEECKAHAVPQYKSGPANIDADYRPAYVGEEELTEFIKNYLNIPNVTRYNKSTGVWSMVSNPEDSEARLDNIGNYFKGDFTELRNIIALQPENKIKVLVGVRTTDDGKQYQDVYTRMTLRNGVRDYGRLSKDVEERKNAGGFQNTEFMCVDLMEYNPAPTNFSAASPSGNEGSEDVGDMPWD